MIYIIVGKHALNEVEDINDLGEVVKFNPTKTLHETKSKATANDIVNKAIEAGWFDVEMIKFDESDLTAPDFVKTMQI